MAHRLLLVGGPGRVGKSSLAHQLLLSEGIPWLSTDVLRTVLRRVLPELDELDQGDVSATAVGDLMYPHLEQALEVCSEEAEQFLVEGPDIVPAMLAQLTAALPAVSIRACFLGNASFSGNDLAGYCGPKPQHAGASRAELDAAASWIRQESGWYRRECARLSLPYVDVGDLGFDAAMAEARRHLLGGPAVEGEPPGPSH
ncbi:MAG TPA: hypothetical protein VI011_21705 [Asanoa sp.]